MKHLKSRLRRAAAVLFAAALLCALSGCAANAELEELIAQARASAAAATSTFTIPQTSAYEPKEAKIPGIAVSADFDPFAKSGADAELSRMLYLRLFALDKYGRPENSLCTDYGYANGVYRMTLKSGLTFAGGDEITARDAAYSLSCVGIYATETDGALIVSGDAGLPARLSEVPIIPCDSREDEYPAPSADYAVMENTITDREGNLLYRLVCCEDEQALMKAYQTGEIESVCVYGADKDAAYVHGRGIREKLPSRKLIYITFNPNSRIFQDAAIRRAVSADIDRTAIAGEWAEAAYTFAPPWSYCSTPTLLTSALAHRDGDVAPLSGGVRILVRDDAGFMTQTAKSVAQSLTNAGCVVTLSALKETDYERTLSWGGYDLLITSAELPIDLSLAGIVADEYAQIFTAAYTAEAFGAMQEKLFEQCPAVPLVFTKGVRYTHVG